MRSHRLAIVIAIILFIIPFFWLKPGEMNLGGDSGRLYFYDPSSYLNNNSLYNFISSGKGSETHSYPLLPYTFLLVVLKWVFQSPTILISIFNGIALTIGFLSVYFAILELLRPKENNEKDHLISLSSILGGLFYVFSQISISNGWENPLLTHSQVFVNPLMFILLLRYLVTKRIRYLLIALLISVVFSFNFSFIGAPTFFSFYPLAVCFLFIYVKFVRNLPIPFKSLTIGLAVFLLLHAFHLAPEISGLLSSGSTFNRPVFAEVGEGTRWGLEYFIAIAANVKLSLIWMTIAQQQKGFWLAVFSIFPLMLIGGLFLNRGKTSLLTGIFFLIAFFFASANLTDLGFTFYKQLFRIPGFSMFRNFHGQWAYSFMFFYALLLGQAIAIVSSRLNKRLSLVLIIGFFIAILGSGLPLIIGRASIVTHTDTGLRYTFQMDPIFEEVLNYFRTNPIDGKILSLPLTAPGYEVFQGKDGGVYQGLSMLTYLAGKSDFAGFESLSPFHEKFLEFIQEQDIDALKKIISIMNIKYIFHNADPFIYSEAFKSYLYSHVSKFTPKDQDEYKSFIEKLPVESRIDFGKNYHIYTVDDNTFTPHIFTTTNIAYTNNPFLFSFNTSLGKDVREVPVFIETNLDKKNDIVLFSIPQAPFFDLRDNSHLHRHEPFVNVSLANPFYRFVLLKEWFELRRIRPKRDRYIDLSLFFLAKRVTEIVKLGDFVPILYQKFEEPKIWEIHKWSSYNSWEASLTRYEEGMIRLMDWITNTSEPETWKEIARIKVHEQLFRQEIELIRGIRRSTLKKDEEQEYLLSWVADSFDKLFKKINIPIYDFSRYVYSLPAYPDREGSYNVYLERKDIRSSDLEGISLMFNNEALNSSKNTLDAALIQFPDQTLDVMSDKIITVNIPPDNLLEGVNWSDSGEVIKKNGILELNIDNAIAEHTIGLTIEVPFWKPKNQYLVSFDYLTFGDDFLFALYDKKYKGKKKIDFGYKQFFEKKLNSKDWKTQQTFVTAEEESLGAFLRIISFSPKDKSNVHIKNFAVTEIRYPNLIFQKTSYAQMNREPSSISFVKINPTKYRVTVEGAKDPYALVFLESFSKNWKLFPPDEDSNMFDTWGKSSIAQENHFKTFEYANAWYIRPDDVGGKENYELIIEFDSQRSFYAYLAISIITFMLILPFFVRSL